MGMTRRIGRGAGRIAVAACLAAGLGAAGTGTAMAASQTETEFFSVGIEGFPEGFPVMIPLLTSTMQFNRFNPALGTLNSVGISYSFSEVGASSSASVEIIGGILPEGETEGSFTLTVSGNIALRFGTGSVGLASTAGGGPALPSQAIVDGQTLMMGTVNPASATCTINVENPDCGPETADNSQFTLDPDLVTLTDDDITPFIGAGVVELTSWLEPVYSAQSTLSDFDTINLTPQVGWNGYITVTYNYTENDAPISTPEPASLALLGAGLGLLGLARRRRRG
jgi:hypothetical protein